MEVRLSEALAQRCSVKKVFLEILQNLQESTCARVSFLIKLQALGLLFAKKNVLKNFTKFTGKHFSQFSFVIFLNIQPLLNKRLWHRCFLVNFAKFLRTTFLQNTSGQLLLES